MIYSMRTLSRQPFFFRIAGDTEFPQRLLLLNVVCSFAVWSSNPCYHTLMAGVLADVMPRLGRRIAFERPRIRSMEKPWGMIDSLIFTGTAYP
jgi:hypothetical protein